MKKLLPIILFTLILTSCGSYNASDVRNLYTGMTQPEVDQIMGYPTRILASNQYSDGVQEVYEYENYRNDVYAIEFWDGRLTGYEFLYEAVRPMYPNAVRPPYRPGGVNVVRPPNRPNKPNRPSTPNRPNRPNRPGDGNNNNPNRPNRPGTETPSTRPPAGGTTTRPVQDNSVNTRPTPSTTTPSTRPAVTPSTRESSTPTTTKEVKDGRSTGGVKR